MGVTGVPDGDVPVVLVVDDDALFRRSFCRSLAHSWSGYGLMQVGSRDEAIELLVNEGRIDVLICDVCLPTVEDGMLVMKAAFYRKQVPAVIAISGCLEVTEAFRLGQMGVQALFEKPVLPLDVLKAVEASELLEQEQLRPYVLRSLGSESLAGVRQTITAVMVEEAYTLCQGKVTHAARLLGLSRQRFYAMMKEYGVAEKVSDFEPDEESRVLSLVAGTVRTG